MHAHKPDRDLPPAVPRLGKLRLHREEAVRSVAPRDNLPSELELGRSAPVLRISARRKVESCILLPVAEGELAVDVVDSCLADVIPRPGDWNPSQANLPPLRLVPPRPSECDRFRSMRSGITPHHLQAAPAIDQVPLPPLLQCSHAG